MEKLTEQQLAADAKHFEALADICNAHGYRDGETAARAIANSCRAEMAQRSRGGQPN